MILDTMATSMTAPIRSGQNTSQPAIMIIRGAYLWSLPATKRVLTALSRKVVDSVASTFVVVASGTHDRTLS